jgi:hypothetical protein
MRAVFRSAGILLVVAALLAFFVPNSYADKVASAVKRVVGTVQPSIGVGSGALNPVLIPQPPVRFRIFIPFRIDANSQKVKITVCVTNLWKADDPTSPHFIPVDRTREVSVVPTNGIEVGDGNNALPFSGQTCQIDTRFPGLETAEGTFESSQRGVFSQEVVVDPFWIHTDQELPVGDYSGFVKLTARIDP